MTVGELIKKLQAYEDETEVLVQSPDDQFVWQLQGVGEDEYEHVYILSGTIQGTGEMSDREKLLFELLIQLACYRNCDLCGQKIDRGYRPAGQPQIDAEDMWPYWHCHAKNCELRDFAERLDVPTAENKQAAPEPSADSGNASKVDE